VNSRDTVEDAVGVEEGGEVQVNVVDEIYVATTDSDPKMHLLEGVSVNPDPERVTTVPPTMEPLEGTTEVTAGASLKTNEKAAATKSTPLLLTDTSTEEALEEGGETQTMLEADTNVAETSRVPNLHFKCLEKMKSAPVTVTLVPPVLGPACGVIPTMVTSLKNSKSTLEDEV
jgi:hypothetical protein